MKKMSIVKMIIKKILPLVFSIITTACLFISIEKPEDLSYVNVNSVIPVVLSILIYYFYKSTFSEEDKKIKKSAIKLGILFGLFQAIGFVVYNFLGFDILFSQNQIIIKSVIYFISFSSLFYSFIVFIYKKLDSSCIKTIKSRKYDYLIIWFCIILMWVPYFLRYFPGILTPDPINEIKEIIGVYELTNNHPLIHVFLIKACLYIGSFFGDYNVGVSIYAIFQMIVMSWIFAYTIKWMIKRNIDYRIIICTFIFYALYPVNGLYSITLWKDVIYSGLILLFTLKVFDIVLSEEYKFSLNSILTISIISIACMLFKNNGFLVILPTLIVLIILLKKYRKQLFWVTSISTLFYMVFIISISLMNIKTTSTIDAFSPIVMPIARVYVKEYDNLTLEEKDQIGKFYGTESIFDYYDPLISDFVKSNMNLEYLKDHKMELTKMWIKYLTRFPNRYLESILINSCGYWFPPAQHWVVARGIIETEEDWQLENGPYEDFYENVSFFEKIECIADARQYPIISMLCSVGFWSWIFFIMIGYTSYKKRKLYLLGFLPAIWVYIHCIFSPVFCEYRYFYPILISMPILIGVNFYKATSLEKSTE